MSACETFKAYASSRTCQRSTTPAKKAFIIYHHWLICPSRFYYLKKLYQLQQCSVTEFPSST